MREESGEPRGESGERRAESGEVRAQSGEPRAESGERRDEGLRLPIILLLESPETIGVSQLRALGADDRIYKPLPVSIVEKRVKDLLPKTTVSAKAE